MFYSIKVKDYVRVPPSMFNLTKKEAVLENIKTLYENYVSKELGFVISVIDVENAKEGVIIPGDGAAFYEAEFQLLTYKPEMNELVFGKVRDITDFGAFINLGPIDGMIHIGQTMDDYVTFSKSGVLSGKETKQNLKVKDLCKARIIAISYKNIKEPKIGLTMRQPYLGALSWSKEKEAKKKK